MPIPFDLLLITDPDAPGGVAEVTRAALSAAPPGRVAVQLRAKGRAAGERVALARSLRAVCHEAGAPLIIHGSADVARLVAAEGLQLPENGLSVADAQALLPAGSFIGCSRHDRAGLEQAARDGASYATLAPVGVVPGKGAPLGVEGFRDAIVGLTLPVYALGGITPGDVSPLRAAGAAGVAVIRAVYASPDPAAAVGAFLAALDAALDA